MLYQDRLARSLATIINVVDPDVIVLGGGLSNIVQLYAGLPALVGSYAFSDGVDTAIKRAAHGDFERRAGRRMALADRLSRLTPENSHQVTRSCLSLLKNLKNLSGLGIGLPMKIANIGRCGDLGTMHGFWRPCIRAIQL